ncbi:MAG: tetratricopeptide repeat protein [Chitinispirillia bacterium]|nr:tetratricopeptide repeat protein [Chitinispirillia bacterium]MCL2267886.1 tetratricopeptide repeat protein [Chitinispirillia bacterium]
MVRYQRKAKKNAVMVIMLLLMTALIVLPGCAGSKKAAPQRDDVYGSRAYLHFLAGDMPRAVENYKRGYLAARQIDNGIGAARYLSNIGRVFYEMGKADSASLYLVKAYEEFKVYGDDAGASKSAAFLAVCFAAAGDEAQARRWFGAASSSLSNSSGKRKDDEHYYAVIRAQIDFRLTSKINNENALLAAESFYKKKKDFSRLATIHTLMADIELSKGYCVTAARRLNDALAAIERSNEPYRRSGMLLKLAAIGFCAGDESAGKHYYGRAADCAPKGVTVPPLERVSSCAWVCR